jgi:hypothetical protein
MEDQALEKIVKFVAISLQKEYGFAGVANGPQNAMINTSDNKGNDIVITITVKKDS